MSDKDKASAEEAGKVEEKKVPEVSDQGKSEDKAEALSQELPENLKGKSPEEITGMYRNLEKKLGEQSGEVAEARKTQEKMNTVLQAIWRNPDLYRGVEREIQAMASGQAVLTDRQPKGREEEAGKTKEDSKDADIRRHLENQAIADFQTKFGIDKLSVGERQELMNKVSTAWANMLDPRGRKTKQELLSSVELDILPSQLENAYWLTQKDALLDKGKLPGQDYASWGSVPSSSGRKDEGVELTAQERQIAEKLGIEPDKYLKRKQQISSEFVKE